MARKTVPLSLVIDNANTILRAPFSTREERAGVIALLDATLHAADAYGGFNYLPTEFAAPGTLRDDYDDTRRTYTPKTW